jgi:RNA-directed DNA polymerase
VQIEEGSVAPRTAGWPQGGVISLLLANLFLHYAFDMWMARTYPHKMAEWQNATMSNSRCENS